ncbi:hypothetical protein ADUPG1_007524, partial [Aduncisulcus paluster]
VEFSIDDESPLDVLIKNSINTDSIRLKDFLKDKSHQLEKVEFADGMVLSGAEIEDSLRTIVIEGSDESDTLNGSDDAHRTEILKGAGGDDTIKGNGGDDVIDGGNGNDDLYGGIGNDEIIGGFGNDQIYGGKGNDIIDGGYGSDTFYFNIGDGFDTISSKNSGNRIIFGEGILKENITFRKSDND